LPSARFLGLLGAAVLIVGLVGLFPSAAVAEEKGAKIEACAECHEDLAGAFKGSSHFAMKAVCTDCHGDAAKHLEEAEAGNILAFKGETAMDQTKQCLTCHKKHGGQYMSGPHAKASMACTSCHRIHKKSYMSHPSKLCVSCHQDVYAEFQLNERHRLQEGVLECTSCHDPHGPVMKVRLSGAFKNQTCLKCHTDKGGPFVYEHEASVVEGCTVCHEVHGSPNRHMLKMQRVGDLCFGCHTAAVSWHSRFAAFETNCANCHSAIHGSNLDKLFLK
jgi:DmsE family decaheme c-type cytochrome